MNIMKENILINKIHKSYLKSEMTDALKKNLKLILSESCMYIDHNKIGHIQVT